MILKGFKSKGTRIMMYLYLVTFLFNVAILQAESQNGTPRLQMSPPIGEKIIFILGGEVVYIIEPGDKLKFKASAFSRGGNLLEKLSIVVQKQIHRRFITQKTREKKRPFWRRNGVDKLHTSLTYRFGAAARYQVRVIATAMNGKTRIGGWRVSVFPQIQRAPTLIKTSEEVVPIPVIWGQLKSSKE